VRLKAAGQGVQIALRAPLLLISNSRAGQAKAAQGNLVRSLCGVTAETRCEHQKIRYLTPMLKPFGAMP
jgi:hypothetical protein